MKAGVFMMPSHPPERSLYDGHQWDLDHLELVDKLGFHEAWMGEHFTAPWEPNPAPDLLIAQGLQRTKNIKLCPGAHLLLLVLTLRRRKEGSTMHHYYWKCRPMR